MRGGAAWLADPERGPRKPTRRERRRNGPGGRKGGRSQALGLPRLRQTSKGRNSKFGV